MHENERTFQAQLLFLAVVGVVTAPLGCPAAASGNSSASGHANLTVGDGQTRNFSFNAVRHPNGTVTGQGEVNNPSFPIRIHFEIDCLKFAGGSRAIASGPITRSSDPATVAEGRIAVFAVEDNGAGANTPPDMITTIPDYEPPKSCNDLSLVGDGLDDDTTGAIVRPLRPIEAGQISVRP